MTRTKNVEFSINSQFFSSDFIFKRISLEVKDEHLDMRNPLEFTIHLTFIEKAKIKSVLFGKNPKINKHQGMFIRLDYFILKVIQY